MARFKYQNPLAKARGLGSAKSGVHHFIVERFTGLMLVPLGIWFVCSLMGTLLDGNILTLSGWLASPWTACFMALFIAAMFIHSAFGVEVIITDYVHCKCGVVILLITNKALHFVFGVISLMAIYKLHYMAATPL
jgi:succinate dehydrogenase / fumarate reductase membrane anchor subunit